MLSGFIAEISPYSTIVDAHHFRILKKLLFPFLESLKLSTFIILMLNRWKKKGQSRTKGYFCVWETYECAVAASIHDKMQNKFCRFWKSKWVCHLLMSIPRYSEGAAFAFAFHQINWGLMSITACAA